VSSSVGQASRSTPAPPDLGSVEYPALFTAADGTSLTGQAWYTGFVRVDLALVVLAAAASAVAGFGALQPSVAIVLRALSVAMLILALLARTTNRLRRPDKDWFGGRAVAESVKTAAWKYMMRGQPYAGPDPDADSQLIGDLRSIMQDRKSLSYASAALTSGGQQITSRMRAVRALPWQQRRDVYLDQRVRNQQTWYASKAQASQHAAAVWFWVGWLAQGAALALAVVSLAAPAIPNIVGVFTSIAAASTGWAQLRHHDELAQSYSVAAQELSLTASEIDAAPDEATFLKGVQAAEDAISREHKLWIAHRE
jgi:hypothetical protein